MCFNMAEAERFELSEPFGSLVFKTSAIDHSAKLPIGASSRFRTADPRRVKPLLYPWAKDALLVAGAGIEPTSVRLMRPMTYPEVYPAIKLERVPRIELGNNPWQGFRLPLHHTRLFGVNQGVEPCHGMIWRLDISPLANLHWHIWAGAKDLHLCILASVSTNRSR